MKAKGADLRHLPPDIAEKLRRDPQGVIAVLEAAVADPAIDAAERSVARSLLAKIRKLAAELGK